MRFQYLAAVVMATAVSGQTTTAAASCPQTCLNAYNTCRGTPGSNLSTCASQYASCLGYSPFGSDGSLITPTACSVSSTSSASATPTANACATACLAAYNTCRGATDSNKATCAAQYAGCLGYSPFGSDGSLITPTACSVTSTSSASATPTVNACASACLTTYNTCRGTPNSNKSFCAAQYAGCLGYSPFGADGSLITPTACSASTTATSYGTITFKPTTTTSLTPYTGAADSNKPFMGMLALGALALL